METLARVYLYALSAEQVTGVVALLYLIARAYYLMNCSNNDPTFM